MKTLLTLLCVTLAAVAGCSQSESPDAGIDADGEDGGPDCVWQDNECLSGGCSDDALCTQCRDCSQCYQRVWKTDLQEAARMLAIDGQGHIIARGPSTLTRISRDGEIEWTIETGGVSSQESPVVVGDHIVVANTFGLLKRYDLSGKLVDEYRFSEDCGFPYNGNMPIAASSSRIAFLAAQFEQYTTKEYHHFQSVSSAMEQNYMVEVPNSDWSIAHPLILSDGRVVFWGIEADYFYAYLVGLDGQVIYQYRLSSTADVPEDQRHRHIGPVASSDNRFYVLTQKGELYSLNDTHGSYWKRPTGTVYRAEPLIDSAGNVYVFADNGQSKSYDQDGNLRWSKNLSYLADTGEQRQINATPLLTADGYLVVPLVGPHIRIVDKDTGCIVFTLVEPGVESFSYSPVMYADGLMVLADYKHIYAYQTPHNGIQLDGWAKGRKDNRNSCSLEP